MELVTVIAVVVTGLATGVLAFVTWRSFEENKKLIEATVAGARAGEAEALASRQQAEAAIRQVEASTQTISEMRSDRELAVAPYLTFDFISAYSNGEPLGPKLVLKNIGQGPALNCLCCAIVNWRPISASDELERATRYFRLPQAGPLFLPLHLGVGSAVEQQAPAMSTFDHQIGQVAFDMLSRDGLVMAAVCEDQFGGRYRFRSTSTVPDRWQPGEDMPPWAYWIPVPWKPDVPVIVE